MAQLVVIGASAGGIQAVTSIVQRLPADFGAAVLLVVHVPAHARSHLPEILSRQTDLAVAHARASQRVEAGSLLIAPPDQHLVVSDGLVRLTRGPRENRHRPSIDVLFRSAARWYGEELIGVLLSGAPGDGVVGLQAISDAGGKTIVQDPGDALFASMPERAIQAVRVDHVLSAADMGALLAQLVDARDERTVVPMGPRDTDRAEEKRPSTYGCPDCGGVLWELDDGKLLRYRCRVGHAFLAETLLDNKAEELETALWTAINALEERASLAQRLAARSVEQGYEGGAHRFQQTADEMSSQAAQIREVLSRTDGLRLNGGDDGGDDEPAAAER